ncbi:hypothetical protein [Paenibacillus antarcticus]|uniref:Uncharacterized protein n=1 Tax=Paenibacillus antarcticus TaxID=253703 RepID=A0A168M0F1_9BACL|nr:hypothetical protein [Paenibacillus antarcticus]OAB44079.1 hypothetical protein PBAT_15805 [Paenibacillus antarcticus]
MTKKRAVTFKPYIKTRYAYEKLRVCRHCQQFTVLWEAECSQCGKSTLVPIRERVTAKVKRTMLNERLIALFIGLVAIYFGQTFLQMILSAAAAILLIALLWFVQRRMLPFEVPSEMETLFEQEQPRIIEDIKRNRKLAVAALKDDELLTYEMLREISTFVQNDKIRLQQVVLLQSFVLRKDMDLRVEPLLIDSFDTDLAAYIGEVAKVQRELIKNSSIRYILAYEAHILEMENGVEILSSVAGAAIRLKKYVEAYPEFIRRYARNIPKDRFLRLYRMIQQHPESYWGNLAEEVAVIRRERYEWDSDF